MAINMQCPQVQYYEKIANSANIKGKRHCKFWQSKPVHLYIHLVHPWIGKQTTFIFFIFAATDISDKFCQIYYTIETDTKWLPFSRRHFNLNENCCTLIQIAQKCVPSGPDNNKPAWFWLPTLRQTGDNQISEASMVCFTDAYLRHLASVSEFMLIIARSEACVAYGSWT